LNSWFVKDFGSYKVEVDIVDDNDEVQKKMDGYNFVLDIVEIWIFVSIIIGMTVFISVAFKYVSNRTKSVFE